MANRLPTPGSDDGDWGSILNDFLSVSLASDGTLNTAAVTNALPAVIPVSNLGTGSPTTSTYLRGDGTWVTPPGSSGSATLAGDTDVSIASPTNNQILAYNGGSSLWQNTNLPTAPVASVFTRTGAVTATTGDYTVSQVTGAAPLASPTFTGKVTTPALQVTTGSGTANQVLTSDVSGNATWQTAASGVILDTTAGDIHALGVQAAGSTGKAADAGHVHPTTGILTSANNLSDLASASTARTNLGLGTAATLSSAALLQAANNLSDLSSTSTARTNLGLGSAATISSTAGGDLSGTLPSPTVAKVNGVAVTGSASDGYVLTATSGTTATWQAPTGGSGSSTLAGDTDVDITSPTNNQILTYNSTAGKWENTTGGSSPVSSVFTRTGAVTAQTGDYTASQVGALPSTDDLSAIATANATAANVAMNSHKITGLANGSASTDAAAFGQIPTVGAAGAGAGVALSSTDSTTTNSRTPTGTAGGDLTGTYPNPTLTGSSNVESIIAANSTVAGAAQKTNNLSDLSSASTARTNLGLGSAATISSTAGGDLSGTLPSPTVAKVNGVAVTGTAANGYVLTATSTTAATWSAASAGGFTGNESSSSATVTNAHTLSAPSTAVFETLTLTSGHNLTITGWGSPAAGDVKDVKIVQPASGTTTNTVNWTGSTFKNPGGTAPTMSTGASVYDIYTVFYDGANFNLITVGQAFA